MTRQRRGEETVRRLLDAALAVYTDDGPQGFTMRAVTARSGVSVGSLYHHFGSFDGLATALYSECMADLLDVLIAALEGVDDPRSGVHALVEAYLGFVRASPVKARFLHASPYLGHLEQKTAAVAKEPRLDALVAWLRPHLASGAVADLPVSMIEMLLIGPVAEVARRWVAGEPGVDLDEAARLLPEPIWRSLSGGPYGA
ncbi:TetR/AcrR family transcriptional regulator [Microbispora sp. H13382]|uniref:TetR/AcrR family transcriptional regulator n=1 Tax=Microbispora sp. H13382 TaxID=2729112 RepID=UPI00160157A9|nr:TetR/AcrR family transcriptional regulator [Microbispora sp. H13382]